MALLPTALQFWLQPGEERPKKKKKKIEIKQKKKNLNKKKWGKPPERPSHAAASGFVVRSRDKQQQLIHGIFFSLLSAPEK